MTDENRRGNMCAELERAAETLAAATLHFENGYISDAAATNLWTKNKKTGRIVQRSRFIKVAKCFIR